jgi:tetratricopeptide (TPR) repeat protein
MRYVRTVALLSLGLLAPGLAWGQGPARQVGPSAPEMYEDIEIMRRLLTRAIHQQQASRDGAGQVLVWQELLGKLGQPSGTAHGPDLAALLVQPETRKWLDARLAQALKGGDLAGGLPAVEGVYLRGYGVVFTLTLPPQPLVTGGASSAPVGKSVSEWDRVRKQLRGEKEEPAAAPRRQGPRLDEAVLKVLAANGHHFAQLGESEKLTVVITFRAGARLADADAARLKELALYYSRVGHTRAAQYSAAAGEGNPSQPSSARDYELLGDLQLKQGRVEEAIKAYGRALALKPGPRQASILYAKTAQAYLLAGQRNAGPGQQQNLVEVALKLLQRSQEELARVEPAGTGSDTVYPTQLIISASKSVLDRAAAVPLDQFRREASVEFRRARQARQKSAGTQ